MSASSLPDLTIKSLFDQSGKVVLVTGGGTGLGLMMATAFVQNGAKGEWACGLQQSTHRSHKRAFCHANYLAVYIASRKMANLQKAAHDLNAYRSGSCVPITADLTTKAGCDKLGQEMNRLEPNGLDVLVNNSGVSYGSPMTDVDEAKGWDRVFNVNVKSLFYLTVALVPLLQKKASTLAPSSVINITSIYASFPYAYMPTTPKGAGAYSYLASKAAAAHLTRSLSTKLKPLGINANAIAPGFYPSSESNDDNLASGPLIIRVHVSTDMTATGYRSHSSAGSDKPTDPLSRSHPSGYMGQARDIAGPALLLASPAGAHLSGISITTDGGFSLAPVNRLPKDLQEMYLPPSLVQKRSDRAATAKL